MLEPSKADCRQQTQLARNGWRRALRWGVPSAKALSLPVHLRVKTMGAAVWSLGIFELAQPASFCLLQIKCFLCFASGSQNRFADMTRRIPPKYYSPVKRLIYKSSIHKRLSKSVTY